MKKKTNSKLTKIKKRFGAFEVRISDEKVEVGDYMHKQRKYVYGNQTVEYQAFFILLGETKATEEGYVVKTQQEVKSDEAVAEFLTYMLNTTQLLFKDSDLRNDYIKGVNDLIGKQSPPAEADETEEEILANLKAEHEAKEIMKDDEELHGGA